MQSESAESTSIKSIGQKKERWRNKKPKVEKEIHVNGLAIGQYLIIAIRRFMYITKVK